MTPDELSELFRRFFTFYYGNVHNSLRNGTLNLPTGISILFPTILLVTNTKSHYIVELLGASPTFATLSYRKHREASVNRYVSQLTQDGSQAHLCVDVDFIIFDGICVGDDADLQELAKRFPAAVHYQDKYRLVRTTGSGSLLSFGPSVAFCTFMNCAFIHRKSDIAYRLKNVMYLAVLSKTISQKNALNHLNAVFCDGGRLRGVHFCDEGHASDHLIASQIQAMYLQPGLRETTLGEILSAHKAVLFRAFGATDAIYEPYLYWQVPQPVGSEEAINPDFLLQRPDKYWDVVDLKTAALTRTDLTRGPRRRRRFVDYVDEGIAQLAHYREYLSVPANQLQAKDKYGVEFLEPRFFLVVGNYENANIQRITEASRQVRDITIIDYDTLIQLFLASPSPS